jgi:hypothetical protein
MSSESSRGEADLLLYANLYADFRNSYSLANFRTVVLLSLYVPIKAPSLYNTKFSVNY